MKENFEKNEKLLLGAYVNTDFVTKFRKYCKKNDFKQRTLFRNVIEFWMQLDFVTQEHLYRGRVEEARLAISKQVAEHQAYRIVSEAEGDVAKHEQKTGSDRRARGRR